MSDGLSGTSISPTNAAKCGSWQVPARPRTCGLEPIGALEGVAQFENAARNRSTCAATALRGNNGLRRAGA